MFFLGLILLCVLNSKFTLLEERKVVLGQTRDNFSVATAALGPGKLLVLSYIWLFIEKNKYLDIF